MIEDVRFRLEKRNHKAMSEEARAEEDLVTFIGRMAQLVVVFMALLALSLGVVFLWKMCEG